MSEGAALRVQRDDTAGNEMMTGAEPATRTLSFGGGPHDPHTVRTDTTSPAAAPPRESLLLFAIGAVVLLVAVLTITPWPVGAFQDDAIYTVLAKALATGEGFRLINLPGSPANTHYPPGYPLVLAALWKLWPSFPGNIVLFKFANAAFLSAAAIGTYLFMRRRLALSPWQATAAALVGTLSVTVLLVTGVVLSEPLFLALALPALLVSERAAETGAVRMAFLAGILLGALAMVRTLGAFAIPAAGLILLWRGHWRAMFALGAAAACFVVPWQLWVSAHQAEIAHPLVGKYGSYGGWLADGYREGGWAFARAAVLRNLQDIDSSVSYMLLPVRAAWPRGIAIVALVIFLLAGTKRYARNAPVTVGFLACYMLVVMLWPFEPNRFLLAVWPLWLPFVCYGVLACWQAVLPGGRRFPRAMLVPWRAAVAIVVLAIAGGYTWYNVTGYSRKWWAAVQRNAGERARPTVEWVARHTSPDDVVATDDDLIVYLYTGRRAVPTSTFTAAERVRPLTPAEDLRAVDEIFAAYDPRWFIVGSEAGRRSAKALAERTPPEVRPVARTSHVLIHERLSR
jgi:hypothetical protein